MEDEPDDDEPFDPEDPELVFGTDTEAAYRAGPADVSLYTFLPPFNVYDHVHIYLKRPGEKPTATYVFVREIGYQALCRYATIHRCTQHLNLKEPTEKDRTIFITRQLKELRDTNFVPQEWEEE